MHHHRRLVIEAVSDLISETIADLPPQLDECFASLDVDVRLLGKETGYNANVDVRLTLPHQGNGLRSELVEVGFQSLKKLSAQAITCALRTPFRIAALPRLEGHEVSQFFLCIIRDTLVFCPADIRSPQENYPTNCSCFVPNIGQWRINNKVGLFRLSRVEELIALMAHHAVARAAFVETVRRRPGKLIILRQKSRVLADSRGEAHEFPKVLISTEDAHLKIMSTFEIDEHLQSCREPK